MKAWGYRLVYYGVPILVLVVSMLAMNTGSLMKRPWSEKDDVQAKLNQVVELSLGGQWQSAAASLDELHSAWDKVRGRVRFHSEDREIETFDLELAGLQGAVDGKDQSQIRIAHRRLNALWQDLAS